MPGFESLPGSHGNFMVRVLGGFSLFWEDSVLRVPRASQRLLAFLALQRRMVKRAAIAGTLWPEASESRASANLRSALARLQGTARKALAADKLELGLAEGIVVDVRDAQGLARRLLDPAVTPDRAELGMAAVPVLAADLLPDELRAATVLVDGHPATEIVDEAGKGIDLLVMGSRNYGPIRRVMVGSTAIAVMRRSPCPVIVIPRGAATPSADTTAKSTTTA